MDFQNRSAQPAAPVAPASPVGPSSARKNSKSSDGKLGRIGVIAAVALVVALLIGVILSVTSVNSSNEASYVDSSKLQAVFLNTGQVYFGHIKTLNNKYFVVSNIYYLQTSNGSSTTASAANTSVSLVKLGCELHEPFDKMVINRSQVTFWENLQDGGQVAKAVATFQQQNPNGQKCADQSKSSSNTSNSVQSAGSGTPTTPATTTKP